MTMRQGGRASNDAKAREDDIVRRVESVADVQAAFASASSVQRRRRGRNISWKGRSKRGRSVDHV